MLLKFYWDSLIKSLLSSNVVLFVLVPVLISRGTTVQLSSYHRSCIFFLFNKQGEGCSCKLLLFVSFFSALNMTYKLTKNNNQCRCEIQYTVIRKY